MKAILTTIALFISISAFSQIDYRPHAQLITNRDSVIVIDWIRSSPKKCPLSFNHLVNFLPMLNENPNTTVSVDLFQNKKLMRSFTFFVGEQANRIYTYEDLKLKTGDHIYFVIKLNPRTNNEHYVFNIYPDPHAAIKEVTVINNTGTRVSEIKKPKTVKKKEISSSHFRKMQRQPIGNDI